MVLASTSPAFIALACVSLLHRKYCVNGTVGTLKKQFKAMDHEIAEVMMVASVAAAGTKLRKSSMGICLVSVKRHQILICISAPSAALHLRGRRRSVW